MSSNPNETFDGVAEDYEAELQRGLSVSGESSDYFAEGRITYLKRCLAAHGASTERVLDYGCGTGSSTQFFFELLGAQSVLGVDVSERSLAVAREKHEGREADFATIDSRPAAAGFDLAFCNGVFHHIAVEARPQAMRYVAESLKPGGYFAFWENNPWSPAARYVMSRIPFDKDAIMVWPKQARGLMRSAGLEVIRTDFHFVFPGALRALRRSEGLVKRLPLGAQYQVLARRPLSDA